MPPVGRKPGSTCIYVVSALLFLAIFAGGSFLVLYILLPDSPATAWFPYVGLALVSTPWLFWTSTFLLRTVSLQKPAASPRGDGDRAPVAATTTTTTTAASPVLAADGDVVVESPGGARRVRFGAVTVVASMTDGVGGAGDSSEVVPAVGGDGGSDAAVGSIVSNEDGSSRASHDSQLSLFAANN